jgi:hypothetical protein
MGITAHGSTLYGVQTQVQGASGRGRVIKNTKEVNTEWYRWHTNIAEGNMEERRC